MARWFCRGDEEWNIFAERLKHTPCPNCKVVGAFSRHGYLRGRDERHPKRKGIRDGRYVQLGQDVGLDRSLQRGDGLHAARHGRLWQAGKADSAPMIYLTTPVLLPLGLPWSWISGKGTVSEHTHLQHLMPIFPHDSLLVGDCFFAGYELFRDIVQA